MAVTAAPEPIYSHMTPDSIGDRLGLRVRRRMFQMFMEQFRPNEPTTVLDMGVTSDQAYLSSNYFETWYPHKEKIIAGGLDDAAFLEEAYPGVRFLRANVLNMPFPDGAFDLVHCSAVLEHVGSFDNQAKMVRECLRVARHGICLTTPNRWFPIEVHTQLPMIHWLPKSWSRPAMTRLGYRWYALEENLNLLSCPDLRRITRSISGWDFQVLRVRVLGWTSNLLLFAHRQPTREISG